MSFLLLLRLLSLKSSSMLVVRVCTFSLHCIYCAAKDYNAAADDVDSHDENDKCLSDYNMLLLGNVVKIQCYLNYCGLVVVFVVFSGVCPE
jgi:hypothetical protein